MVDVVLLAAGKGVRAKLGYPKQFAMLGGKPVMVHSLEMLGFMPEINKIIITCPSGELSFICHLAKKYVGEDKAICIEGGETRQQSVYNALRYVKTERILIHEAVRPFITKEFVANMLSVKGEAVVPGVSISPTVFDLNNNCYPNRDKLLNIQLPQLFDTKCLKHAHERAKHMTFTDDSSLLFSMTGIRPVFVAGSENNIKITTPLDLVLAEAIYYEQ